MQPPLGGVAGVQVASGSPGGHVTNIRSERAGFETGLRLQWSGEVATSQQSTSQLPAKYQPLTATYQSAAS